MSKILTFFLLFSLVSSNSYAKPFRDFKVGDLNVFVSVDIEQSVEKILLNYIEKSFSSLKSKISKNVFQKIKQTKIWISNESNYPFRKGEKTSIVYHRSKEWLESNNLNTEYANSIHIINPRNFVERKIIEEMPNVLIHELSHSLFVKLSAQNRNLIKMAYSSALKSSKYRNVTRNNYLTVKEAYALQNELEYFGELSEAYFGKNDFFPYTSEQLYSYDRVGFNVVEYIWKSI